MGTRNARSRQILMMLNDDKTNRKRVDLQIDKHDENSYIEEDEKNKPIHNLNIDSSADYPPSPSTIVQKWIDSNNFDNQLAMSLDSTIVEAGNPPMMNASSGKDIIVEPLTERHVIENQNSTIVDDKISETTNAPKHNINAISDYQNEDFSPSEGSDYEPPRQTRRKIVPSPSSRTSCSSTSSSSSSSSSSTSSSSSSIRAPVLVNNTTDLGNDGGNIEQVPALPTNDEGILPESNKRQSRKRQRNTHAWKQTVSKRLKNCGQEYTSKRGKVVPAKSILPPCNDKCRLSCTTKVSFENRENIFKSYWELGDHQRQRDFLASCVKQIQPATRKIIVPVNIPRNKPIRKPNSSYYFVVNGKEVRVCKTFLLNTLVVGEKTLRKVINNTFDSALSLSATDKRGKHSNHSKLSDEVLQSVFVHINSIPRTESHYLRANTTREFIDGSLTVAELHRDYQALRQAAGRQAVNYDAYYRIFHNNFNIGLYAPRKDQCDECEAFKNAIDKEPLLTKHNLHMEEKRLARSELEKDIQQSKQPDSNTIVAIFDLQAVLPCPIGQSSAFFYKSKLNCYNFTVSNLNEDKTFCFFWHEGLAKRGANEIGTCVYKFLEELSNNQPGKDIIFYSDNCCGQQKNKFVFGMFYYAVNTLAIKSITHKFLIRGHTQNKADSVHSVIEKNIKRAKKAGPIYCPAEYISLIRNAKKRGNGFIVNELNFDSFFDLKSLSVEVNLNLNKDVDRNNIRLSELKVIKFTKKLETYQFRYSYQSDIWTEANVKISRTGNKKQIKDLKLNVLYTEKLPIPDRKRDDIRQLIASNIVPKFYEQYYNGLF